MAYHFPSEYDAYERNKFQTKMIKCAIIFFVACIFIGLGISVFAIVKATTSGFITSVEPLDPIERDTVTGNGLLIRREGQTVKLKNTGTYDVLPGAGIIIDHFEENFPIVSLNQTYINQNTNATYNHENVTTFLNTTTSLSADESIILSPTNPWVITMNDAIASANISHIRENLNLNTLTASTGLIMNVTTWNPTNGNAVMTVNQTYINENLNLSSLSQGTGINITANPWNPSGASATIFVDQANINANLNLSSLSNGTSDVVLTPNPWNPSTGGDAFIELDQQGFLAICTSIVPVGANSTITGCWDTSVDGAWTKGGFDSITGVYTVPTTGYYEFNFRIQSGLTTGIIALRVNDVRIYRCLLTATNKWLLTVTVPVNAGDTVDMVTDIARGFTGTTTVPWLSFFGANKVGT